MSWTDPPASQPAPWPPVAASSPPNESPSPLGGAKRLVATTLLAIGLLAVGGVAVVSAADPSASAAPNATTQPSGNGGTGGTAPRTHTGTCPNMGGSSGSGSSGGSTAPSTNGSTSSPSTSDL